MRKGLIGTLFAVLLCLVLLVGCGGNGGDTTGEDHSDQAYKVTFVCDENVSVYAYNTQDMTSAGTKTTVAYSRDGETGELLKDGTGQVNFKLTFADGYELAGFEIDNEDGFNKVKGYTYDENSFRITKISSDLTVNVTTQTEGTAQGYEVTFVYGNDAQVTVYKTQEAGIYGANEKVYSRDGDLGTPLNDGDGQVNFRVEVADGYKAEITITTADGSKGYKNLKIDPEDEGDTSLYRITKITADLTVTVTTTKTA